MMEERLAVVTSNNWTAGDCPPEQVVERQQVINKLETQVEEQVIFFISFFYFLDNFVN